MKSQLRLLELTTRFQLCMCINCLGGGDKKIENRKVEWNTESKVQFSSSIGFMMEGFVVRHPITYKDQFLNLCVIC